MELWVVEFVDYGGSQILSVHSTPDKAEEATRNTPGYKPYELYAEGPFILDEVHRGHQ